MDSVLDFMKEDHERISKILDQYLDSKSQNEAETLIHFKSFKKELFRHFDWEEKFFFPLLDRAIKKKNSTNMEGLRREHNVLREFVREIYFHIAAGDFEVDELDQTLRRFLQRHKEKEIEGLYILIDKTIDDEQRHDAFKKLVKEFYF